MTPFEQGFVKAAMAEGFDQHYAVKLLKFAAPTPAQLGLNPAGAGHAEMNAFGQPTGLQPTMAGAMAGQGLMLGGLGGAGYGAYKESDKPEKERNYVRAMLGSGALGGGAGMLGGGALGMLLGGNQRIL